MYKHNTFTNADSTGREYTYVHYVLKPVFLLVLERIASQIIPQLKLLQFSKSSLDIDEYPSH